MKFVAVHRSFLLKEPGLLASDGELGVWVRLGSAASEREIPTIDLEKAVKEGVVSEASPLGELLLPNAKGWTDRQLMMAAQVDRAGLDAAERAGLCRWIGNDLAVDGQDLWGVHKVRAARANGGLGGRPKRATENPVDNPPDNPLDNRAPGQPPPPSAPQGNQAANHQASQEGGPSPLPCLPPLPSPAPSPSIPPSHTRSGSCGPVRARELIETFSRIRSEVLGVPRWQAPPSCMTKADGFAPTFETTDDVAAIEPTMRLAITERRGAEGGDVRDASYAFSVWVQRFSSLREELLGLTPDEPGVGKHCSLHSDRKNRGVHPPKHAFRTDCPECRRVGLNGQKPRDVTVGVAAPSTHFGGGKL
jgi:hypothetical protein